MGLEIRPTAGQGGAVTGVSYNPSRDIVHLCAHVVATVEQQLYSGPFEPLAELLSTAGIDEEALAETVRTYCLFLNYAHQDPEEDVVDCMRRSGFLDQPALARIAMMFYIGSNITGTIFTALRDVTRLGADAKPDINDLLEMGERVQTYLNRSRLQRWFIRLWRRWFPRRSRKPIHLPGA